jgi:ATP-binding cassette subfamily C protein
MRLSGIFLVALAIVNGVLESAGALLVFALVNALTRPDSIPGTFVVGTLYRMSPATRPADFTVYLGVIVAVFYVIKNAMLLGEAYLQNRFANEAATATAVELLESHFAAPYETTLLLNSAETIRTISFSVDAVFRFALLGLVGFVSEMFIVLAMAAALLVISPLVTLLAAAVLASMVGVLFGTLNPRFQRWGQVREELQKQTLKSLQQSLGASKELRVLGRESAFVEGFAGERTRLSRMFTLHGTGLQMPRVVLEAVFVVVLALIVSIVSLRGQAGASLLPLLGLYAYVGFRLIPSLNRLVSHLNNVRYGIPSIENVRAALPTSVRSERFGEGATSEPPAPLPSAAAPELRSVCYQYPASDQLVLADVSLKIRAGERIGIVGPTGAGKSTMLDVILGLLPPSAGQILVNGRELESDPVAWRRSIGYVSQFPYLVDDTLRRNIALGVPDPEIDEERVRRVAAMARLDEFLERLDDDLDTVIGERGVRLSGGQRQRVAIARALYNRASVLVLDEATSSLDNNTEADITRAIENLGRSTTVIIVAHRLSTVRNCDRIVFLSGGRIVDVGTFDELTGRSRAFRDFILNAELHGREGAVRATVAAQPGDGGGGG